MKREIIATQGHTRYLILLGTRIDPNSKKAEDWGEILDLDQKKVYGPDYLSIWYTHGNWEPYTGDQNIIDGLYSHVTRANKAPK